jgi:hypothetical protein
MVENNVLRMYSIPAKIDITTVKPLISAKYVKAKLDIQKTPAYVDMQSKNITCNIDSSACMAEEGHKTTKMLTEDFAQQGMRDIHDTMHETAVKGQELVHAGKSVKNFFKNLAKQKVRGSVPLTGIKFIPSQRPTITWSMNELKMEGHPAKYDINWDTTTFADISIKREGSVTVTEVQKPELHIEYVGNTDTLYLFHSMDQRA